MGELLYHYCSFDTFIEILKNKKFRFSDITRSNDWQEILFLWEEYLCDGNLANKVFEKQQRDNTTYLVACFSKNNDSKNMWDEYGDCISIGFSKSALQKWAKKFEQCFGYIRLSNTEEQSEFVRMDKVNYVDREGVKDLVDKEKCNDIFIDDSFDKIFKEAPFTKTKYWAQENEFRIAISYIISNIECDIDDETCSKVSPYTNENKGTYLICDISFEASMIKTITLSPKCYLSEVYIRGLLKKYGFDFENIEIKKSIASKF